MSLLYLFHLSKKAVAVADVEILRAVIMKFTGKNRIWLNMAPKAGEYMNGQLGTTEGTMQVVWQTKICL